MMQQARRIELGLTEQQREHVLRQCRLQPKQLDPRYTHRSARIAAVRAPCMCFHHITHCQLGGARGRGSCVACKAVGDVTRCQVSWPITHP